MSATFSGDTSWAANSSSTNVVSFTVTKASQTITFAALANKALAQSPLTVSGTASSGLTVTFTADDDFSVHLEWNKWRNDQATGRLGRARLSPAKPATRTYNPAPSVSRSFTVSKA